MSGELNGAALDVRAVTGGPAGSSGVAHGDLLVAFAEACVGDDAAVLADARDALAAAAGPEELVEAAATVGNFERMVRIADGTGIPLDGPLRALSNGLEHELDLVRFGSAGNSPEPGGAAKLAQGALGMLLHGGLRLAGRFRRARQKP